MTHSLHRKEDIAKVRLYLNNELRNWPRPANSDWMKKAIRLLDAGKDVEVVAHGMQKHGLILDCICPEEHASYEGDYTVPLYAITQPDKEKTA